MAPFSKIHSDLQYQYPDKYNKDWQSSVCSKPNLLIDILVLCVSDDVMTYEPLYFHSPRSCCESYPSWILGLLLLSSSRMTHGCSRLFQWIHWMAVPPPPAPLPCFLPRHEILARCSQRNHCCQDHFLPLKSRHRYSPELLFVQETTDLAVLLPQRYGSGTRRINEF